MHIFTADEIKQIDADAAKAGLSEFTLMENAGRGLFQAIEPLLNKKNTIAILSGRGNNGGDGIVLARYLQHAGYPVALMFPIGEPETETAKAHAKLYKNENLTITTWDESATFDVIIDCLLGVGTKLPLRENITALVRWANKQHARRIAVDLPTGVEADTGAIGKNPAEVFRADYTFSLHGAKASAFLAPASDYYGKLAVVPIGLRTKSNCRIITKKSVQNTLPKRSAASHKGTFGMGIIVAGSEEMPGSAALAAIGAIRSGAGRLLVATEKNVIPTVAAHVPEATFMADGLARIAAGEIPEKLSAAAIGPGLIDAKTTKKALTKLFQEQMPIVVDAGALLADMDWQAQGPVIVTPHPGEFSRLTGIPTEEIQQNRMTLARDYAKANDVIVVLKGQYTVIAFPSGDTYVNETGNSGLAKGGSGDVLTGILLSFLATHEKVKDAVINAVYVHGYCADLWQTEYSEASMTASDFAALLPKALKQLEVTSD